MRTLNYKRKTVQMSEHGGVTMADLRTTAETMLADRAEGQRLTVFEVALIRLGVAASVTSLDRTEVESTVAEAYEAGASSQQVHEVVSLVSGLGVHSLMVSAPIILNGERQLGDLQTPLTVEQRELWDRHVGDDPFWEGFEREMPGFLDAMLRLSTDQFAAFFIYCAVPWKSGSVRAWLKELIAMASDAAPTHRFLPGFRLHLANAITLGAGRAAVMETLDLAAAAPPHRGTR